MQNCRIDLPKPSNGSSEHLRGQASSSHLGASRRILVSRRCVAEESHKLHKKELCIASSCAAEIIIHSVLMTVENGASFSLHETAEMDVSWRHTDVI
jgi:hypothetical protein